MKSLRFGLVALLLMVFVVPASAYYEFAPVDFGGQTVNMMFWWDVTTSDRFSPDRIAEAEELFNVKLVFPVNSWEDSLEVYMNRLLSGESEWDIWYATHQQALPMIADGALYSMNQVLPEEYYESLYPAVRMQVEALRYQGNTFGLNSITSPHNDMVFWVWNKTLFEREGFRNLDDAYVKGEWTWELATEIAIAATKDTNNDGVIDQYGMSYIYVMPIIVAAGGNAAYFDEATQKWTFDLLSDVAMEALNYVYEWENVHQVVSGDWMQTPFREGTRAFANMQSWMFWSLANEMDDEWGILPYPRTSFNDEYAVPAESFSNFFVPSNAKNPVGLAAIVNFFAPEGEDFYYEVAEGAVLYQAPDRLSAEVLESAILNWTGAFNMFRDFSGQSLIDEAISAIVSGEKTPAQAMSEIRLPVQAAIDALMRQ